MRAVIQRVKRASVTVDGQITGSIDEGLMVLLGVGRDDSEADARYLVDKVLHLRVFPDEDDKMNRSVLDMAGGILVVSQFTLLGDCRKGRRPSYNQAAPPKLAEELYETFVAGIRQSGLTLATGTFQAMMDVELVNNGPVTLLLDSQKIF